MSIAGFRISNFENYGILCRGDSTSACENVTFSGNTVAGNLNGYGIVILNAHPRVENCVIEGCDYGIYAVESGASLEDNVIRGPGDYGIRILKDGESPGADTITIDGDSIVGYFTYAMLGAASKGHARIDNARFIGDTNSSGQFPPYGVKVSTGAWMKMRHSKILDYSTAGFYYYQSNANLGEGSDTGFNAIYVTDRSDSCSPKSAIHVAPFGFGPGPPQQAGLMAEGNWWGSDSPNSCWFTFIDYTPWLNSDPLGKSVPQPLVERTSVPDEYSILQNYPNPFNPSTIIEFSLPAPARTRIEIFNILGQRIRILTDEELPAGQHIIEWDGRGTGGRPLASGIYLYRLSAGDHTATRKMVLLR